MRMHTMIWKLFRYFVPIGMGGAYLIFLSMFAGLSLWQSILIVASGAILIWGGTFTFLEVRRIVDPSKARSVEDEIAFERSVIVEPPTGEPYPHHEDHVGSPGEDQGQLTSHLSGSTPLVDRLLSRLRSGLS